MPAIICPNCGAMVVLTRRHLANAALCPRCQATLNANLPLLSAGQVIAYFKAPRGAQLDTLRATASETKRP